VRHRKGQRRTTQDPVGRAARQQFMQTRVAIASHYQQVCVELAAFPVRAPKYPVPQKIFPASLLGELYKKSLRHGRTGDSQSHDGRPPEVIRIPRVGGRRNNSFKVEVSQKRTLNQV
jgi:hypothetical protein